MPTTIEDIGLILRSHKLSENEAHCLKWQFHMLGDFEMQLMTLIARADDRNLRKLALGFPIQVGAFIEWSRGGMGKKLRGMGLDL